MEILNVANPRYVGSHLVLDVEFEGIGVVEFCASPDDPEEYGRDLYSRTVAGEFGDIAPDNSKPSVPQVVTMRQAKLALLQMGLLDSVDSAIVSIEDLIERKKAEIEWQYAAEVERNWPTLVTLTGLMGLTDSDIDSLFILAGSL